MSMKTASDPKDVQDFQFKQSCIRQIFDGFKSVPIACNLIATDGKRGLLYVGHENKITVLKCNDDASSEWKFEHELPHAVSRIALSCNNEYLSVTFHKSTARIYNASSLTKNVLELLQEIQLSSSSKDVFAYDLKWNPAVPGMFCTVASDHTIGSFIGKTERKATVGLFALEKIEGHEVLCIAWSPKGKQMVVGCRNGNIVQMKPDLKIARTITGPSPGIGGVISILWISNYQFCATYQDSNSQGVNVLIVDAPKGETKGIFTCYDDITYGMPEAEAESSSSRYYLDHVAEWGLIIAASSSSSEVAVLGSIDNGSTWQQWQLTDSGRAQLPLIRTTESYPVGMAIDRSSEIKLPWGPETILANPVPVLHVFDTSGQLISFHMVNLTPNCAALCTPPTEIVTAVPAAAPRPSLGPSEMTFNLNAGVTSTPRIKQAEVPIERPKIVPSTNLFNETVKPPAPVPVQHVELKLPKPRAEKVEVPPTTIVERSVSPVKDVPPVQKPEVDESLCLRAYFEEQMLFEKELKAKLEPQVWECGTEEERKKLPAQSAIIDEFLRDLRETTNSLSSDIAYLKALLLQSFAWLEETKSKNSANFSDNPRDRGDGNKIKELQRLFFYTQSQLIQATKALDMEWVEHESRKETKIKIPSLEFVYQSLKRHSEIIAKEKSVLELQKKKWKSITRGNKISGLNKSMSKLNLSSSQSSASKNSDNRAIELRCKAIANNARCFTSSKQQKLREMLLETEPRIIKAINPSPVQDRLEATLCSLASLNSVQSVPKSKPQRNTMERMVSSSQTIPKNTQQSPLASLNSIVAKFGPVTTEESTTQNKSQSKLFSTTSTPLFGTNISQIDKKQPVVTPAMQTKPKQGVTITMNQRNFGSQLPSNPRSQAFSEVQSISFGNSEQKHQAQPAVSISNDGFSKSFQLATSKDNASTSGPIFFQDTSTKHAPSSGLATSKNEPQTATLPLGPSMTFAGVPEGTTIEEVLRDPTTNSSFYFTNPVSSAMTATNASTEVTTPTTNLQRFSFASKPIDSPAFSFALKESTTTNQGPAQGSSELPGLFNFDLSISNQPVFGKLAMPSSTINFGEATSAAATNTSPSTPATSQSVSSSEQLNVPLVSANIFSQATASSPGTNIPQDKVPSSVPNTSIFGSGMASSGTTSSIFGGASTGLTSSLFGGMSSAATSSLPSSFSIAQPSTTSANGTSTAPIPASTASPPSFSKLSSTFGSMLGNPASTLNFGAVPSSTSNPPAFSKPPETPAASSIFSQPSAASSASPNITKTAAASVSPGIFGGSVGTSSNTSVFGNISATPAAPIFGGALSNPAPTSVFEGNSAPMAPFGSPASNTIFGSVKKSPSSIFGGGAPMSAFSGAGVQAASPVAAESSQPTSPFGQASTFGAKPVFGGQTSVFGAAKPDFSNPFGTSTFGASAVPQGFNSPPGTSLNPLGTTSPQKVFGDSAGNSSFESLAGQNGGLTFGSLAQKTPEPQKPPAFSGGSSFSSWR